MAAPVQRITLPDGTVCGFAGEGATLAFEGERLNYTCEDPHAPTYGLLGPVQVAGAGQVEGVLATISHGNEGFVLDNSEPVAGLATALTLEDGTTCLFAGEGATLAFDGKRLNYTCGSPETGLIGDLVDNGDNTVSAELAMLTRAGDQVEIESNESVTARIDGIDLESGMVCLHAGEGATLAFDGERLTYTCDDPAAPMVGLLGDLAADDLTITVNQATIAHGADGFVLDARVPVALRADRLVLEDGTVCLFAGEGATLAFDGDRANYTCGSPELVLLGGLTADGLILTADQAALTRSDDAFVVDERQPATIAEVVAAP